MFRLQQTLLCSYWIASLCQINWINWSSFVRSVCARIVIASTLFLHSNCSICFVSLFNSYSSFPGYLPKGSPLIRYIRYLRALYKKKTSSRTECIIAVVCCWLVLTFGLLYWNGWKGRDCRLKSADASTGWSWTEVEPTVYCYFSGR